jgi:hypothetical protein
MSNEECVVGHEGGGVKGQMDGGGKRKDGGGKRKDGGGRR